MLYDGSISFWSCKKCSHRQVEAFDVCPSCLAQESQKLRARANGKLYSFSIIQTSDKPIALGYVDLENGLRVLAALAPPFANYKCDQPVDLTSSDGRITAYAQGRG